MIPYRISFTGIRDYKPTKIDLSGSQEHILIAGANGAGKSTLTFCWGAVMASSKVNIEGLRSKNLPDHQVWRSQIELIYENNGFIDAARFVKFRIALEQLPGQPIKKAYYIAEGDAVDEWDHETRFSSTDKHFNFREYKRLLLQKYKIDPDAFYLIWYQQDVNQFAVMKPEERFRIFSEMTGIDKLQKSLEAIKDSEREAESAMQVAKNNRRQYKFDLDIWKQEKDRYEGQQLRLKGGLIQYKTALDVLENYYNSERLHYQEELEETKERLEDKREESLRKESDISLLEAELAERKDGLLDAEKELERTEDELGKCKEEKKEYQREYANIAEEIKEITERVNSIPSEKEVYEETVEKEQYMKKSVQEKARVSGEISGAEHNQHQLVASVESLKIQVQADKEAVKYAKSYIEQYSSSFSIEQQQMETEQLLRQKKDEAALLITELEKKRDEQKQLKSNRYVSPRQEEGLRYFKRKGVKAYPLRDLIELEGDAEIQVENILNTIKYTIFVEAKQFIPPNDLYYVSLPLIIPTESVVSMPQYKLKIKDRIDDRLVPVALKALWWVKQFFTDEYPCIQRNALRDERGLRGAQEKGEYILSEKAIAHRLQETAEWIEKHENLLVHCNESIAELTEKEKKLRDIAYKVREAEAVLQKAGDRAFRIEMLERKQKEKENLEESLSSLRKIDQELHTRIEMVKQRLEKLHEFALVYRELEKEQEKIARMQQLEALQREVSQKIKVLESQKDELGDTCNELENQCEKLKRKGRNEKLELEGLREYMQQLEKKHKQAYDSFITSEENLITAQRQQRDVRDTYGDLLEKLEEKIDGETWSEITAISKREEGKAKLDYALQEDVNPLAPENYEKMKVEYERSNDELHNSEQILSEIRENMEVFTERLETTIQMNVYNIHKNFEHYMEQFHFEGKVEWHMEPNKHGEMRYYLYIKARKKGHRGKMEDISAKGRGGKVGSGVSGGEESLSSLLFALALLKTIEASPGYIILDEYDSALDDNRKEKVFTLFEEELQRKMIIVSPKSHDPKYLNHFSKSIAVMHDASVPVSKLIPIKRA
ncbi:hypothetical protein CN373_10860 [Bacillus cereus]|uniref:hypothetical protein n=1 Tax=Bacillus cereus TaxID=1396 RepID=UPI000BF967BD|nr:hypothetical protein [Bacillus cereus]PFA22253.1 hypothetical protein CN373_10860 [Bacillus cereus]